MSPSARSWRRIVRPSAPGQHDVEHDEVGPVVGQPRQRARSRRPASCDAQPVALEVAGDDLADHRLVVDDEHAWRRRRSRRRRHRGDSTTASPRRGDGRRRVSRYVARLGAPADSARAYRRAHGCDDRGPRSGCRATAASRSAVAGRPPRPGRARRRRRRRRRARRRRAGLRRWPARGPSLVSASAREFIDRFAGLAEGPRRRAVRHQRQGRRWSSGSSSSRSRSARCSAWRRVRRPLGRRRRVRRVRRSSALWAYLDDPLGDDGDRRRRRRARPSPPASARCSSCCGWPALGRRRRPAARSARRARRGAGGRSSIGRRRAFAVAWPPAAAVLGRRDCGTERRRRRRPARAPCCPRPAPLDAVPPASRAVRRSPGLSPYVTPNADFYRIDTALVVPQVDVAGVALDDHGHGRPTRSRSPTTSSLAMDRRRGRRHAAVRVERGRRQPRRQRRVAGRAARRRCSSGPACRPAPTQVVGRSVDGFTAGFPTDVGLDGRTALVAYAMNGEPLPATHGFPARLVVAGLYGYVSATKWLERDRADDVGGLRRLLDPARAGRRKVRSRRRRASTCRAAAPRAPPGRRPIAGVAWAPTVGIEQVEVQVDDGEWQRGELGDAASDNTWVQWYLDWEAAAGEHTHPRAGDRRRRRDADRGASGRRRPTAPPAGTPVVRVDGAADDVTVDPGAVLAWGAPRLRDLPWRATRDPWRILVLIRENVRLSDRLLHRSGMTRWCVRRGRILYFNMCSALV